MTNQVPAAPLRPSPVASVPALLRPEEDQAPAGEDYVASIYETVHSLVALDVAAGGNEAARSAVPALSAVLRRLHPAGHTRRWERDLHAAAAELAELTGWLLCDANRQRAARRANRIAMTLARRCGHRSMELFVIHNMSLQATYLRRPRESFDIIRPVLDQARLTPRLSSMFRLRLARAYAQMGLRGDAFRALDHAHGLLLEGVSDDDPTWSWWISERGFHHATGAMYGTLGEWREAIDPLRRALDVTPAHADRDRFLYLCVLLHAHIEVGAWRDAETTATDLAALIGVVGSDRPLARLVATTEQVPPRPNQAHKLHAAVEPVRQAMRDRVAGAARST